MPKSLLLNMRRALAYDLETSIERWHLGSTVPSRSISYMMKGFGSVIVRGVQRLRCCAMRSRLNLIGDQKQGQDVERGGVGCNLMLCAVPTIEYCTTKEDPGKS